MQFREREARRGRPGWNAARPRAEMKRARERSYTAWFEEAACWVNLAGDYDYLEAGYYISQDLEAAGASVHPTCKEMLDAYVTPLFLEKARLAGLAVPESYITNGYFEPPVVIDPINPFMSRSRTVLKPGRQESVARSMTRNFTYAMCCQEIPPGGRVRRFRAILGWTGARRYREAARPIWEIFRIPLAVVRVIVLSDGRILLSDISQLPFAELGEQERAHLESRVTWERSAST